MTELYTESLTAVQQVVSFIIREFGKRQESMNFHLLRMNSLRTYKQLKITQMQFHCIQTLQQDGQWEHGMLTSV